MRRDVLGDSVRCAFVAMYSGGWWSTVWTRSDEDDKACNDTKSKDTVDGEKCDEQIIIVVIAVSTRRISSAAFVIAVLLTEASDNIIFICALARASCNLRGCCIRRGGRRCRERQRADSFRERVSWDSRLALRSGLSSGGSYTAAFEALFCPNSDVVGN